MALNNLPSLNRLNELFEYRQGNLYNKTNRNSRSKKGEIAGTYSGRYGNVFIDGHPYTIHRIIFFMNNEYSPEFIDHINGNKHDNRIENLREAKRTDNQHNRALNKNNTSGAKNVYWSETKQKWCAGLRHMGKKISLGVFDKLEDAIVIVTKFREENHGVFANHGTFKGVV